jgi:serine/threonine-protein kinase
VPQGQVMDQSPDADASTFKGTTVTLTVSKGVETFPVPDVIGKPRNEARDIVERAGFRVSFADFPGRRGRTVVDQDPAGGERRRKGTTVTLYMF